MRVLLIALFCACVGARVVAQPAPASPPTARNDSLMFPIAPVKQAADIAPGGNAAAPTAPARAELTAVPRMPGGAANPAKLESLVERPSGAATARDTDRLVDRQGAAGGRDSPQSRPVVAARAPGGATRPAGFVPIGPAPGTGGVAGAPAAAPPVGGVGGVGSQNPVVTGLGSAVLGMLDSNAVNQGVLTVQPGATELIPIARGALNRIVTPFETVRARHSLAKDAGASITAADNVIYVGTYGDAPISAFLVDSEDEARAISVVFVPRDIPPRDLRLKLASAATAPGASGSAVGSAVTPVSAPAGNARDAIAWEQSQPYVDGVKSLLRTLALAEIPPGYNLIDPGASNAPRCTGTGVRTTLGQVLEGGRMTVAIHRAQNTSDAPVNVNEQGCYQPGVLAVAAWPRALLHPGEDTELYVVLRKDHAESRRSGRPSLLQAAQPTTGGQ